MISLADVWTWVKGLGVGDNFYVGKLDAKKERSIGIYQREAGTRWNVLGGTGNKKHSVKAVTLLVHWNKDARETEEAAVLLYEKIMAARNVQIAGKNVFCIDMMYSEPVALDSDSRGIFEYGIYLDIYYER